jgi:hypothetical protein
MNPGYAISVKNKPHTKPCRRLVPGVGTTESEIRDGAMGLGTADPGALTRSVSSFIDEGYSLGVESLKITFYASTGHGVKRGGYQRFAFMFPATL